MLVLRSHLCEWFNKMIFFLICISYFLNGMLTLEIARIFFHKQILNISQLFYMPDTFANMELEELFYFFSP